MGVQIPSPLPVLRGEAGLPRGARFTVFFSSLEKQSRLEKSGSRFPGEKHSTQLWGGRAYWGSTDILLWQWGAESCMGWWPLPAVMRAGHQSTKTRAPAELKSEWRGRGSPGLPASLSGPTCLVPPSHCQNRRGPEAGPLPLMKCLLTSSLTGGSWSSPRSGWAASGVC